jgi:hypothetical protein
MKPSNLPDAGRVQTVGKLYTSRLITQENANSRFTSSPVVFTLRAVKCV